MPNFIFPLLYRNRALPTHEVNQISVSPLITSGKDGDMIVWDNLQPQTLIYPNLSHSHGQVLQQFIVNIPFFSIMDKVEECLVTLHQDRRIRIFDLRDGRCLSVSPHDTFVEPILFCEPLNRKKCRFILFSGEQGLYLLDIWRMKCVKHYMGHFRGICSIDINTICALDVDNKLHIINLSPLNSERFCNYYEFSKKRDQITQDLKEFKLNDGLQIQQLDYLPSQQKIQSMSFNFETQQLNIVFIYYLQQIMNKQIWIISDLHAQPTYINLLQSKNNYKFQSVHYYKDYFLITTRNGSLLNLLISDLLYFQDITKQINDFVYGFKEFQFTKIADTHFSRLQLNLQPIIIGSNNKKDRFPIKIQDSSIYQCLYQVMRVYSLDKCLKSNNQSNTYIDVSLLNENGISFKGFTQKFNQNSAIVQLESINIQQIPINEYSLIDSYNDDLMWNLSQISQNQFQNIYLPKINLEGLKIHSSFMNIETSIYYFGCDNGTVYGFPMNFQINHCYNIYTLKLDDSPIKLIYQKGKNLIVSSQNGKFIICTQFPNYQIDSIVAFIPLKYDLEYIFPAHAKSIIRIYKLENESYNQEDEQLHQIEIAPIKLFKMAIQLDNNVIIVFSLETGEICLKLFGIPQNIELYGLYHDDQADQWVAVTENGNAQVYDGKGRYIRTILLEQFYSLFQVEKKLNKCKEKLIPYHKLSEFNQEFNKSISKIYHYLEFSQRGNYIKQISPYPSLYEVGGHISSWEFEAKDATKILYLLDHHNNKQTQRTCRFVQTTIGEIEWWDLKKPINVAQDLQIQGKLFITLHPWGADAQIDKQLDNFLGNIRPTFEPLIGIQSIGYAVSFPLQKGWNISEYQTSMRSMSLMHYYLNFLYKDSQLFNNLMVQTVELLTRKNIQLDHSFKNMNLMILASYTIDDSNEVMTAACNLIISSIKKNDNEKELMTIQKNIRELLDKNQKNNQSTQFSNVEVICLVLDSYISGLFDKSLPPNEDYKKRALQGINLRTCVVNPHLCAPLLKVLVDVMAYFKSAVVVQELLKDLFFMFFNYNTVLDYLESIRDTQGQAIKGINILREISKQPEEMKKRMKQLIVKAIIHVANNNMSEFSQIIRKDIVNLEINQLYPCSIIDIIRHFIKSQQVNAIKHLPFLMEIILKSLDPNNPNLRRVCHRPATSALHTICKAYKCVSFHQSTQKIALGSTENQIIIYDLRTAVKWRVFDGHEGQVTALEFDHTGKQLASFSKNDWRIKVWKVGSTGFFGSILGIQGRPMKDQLLKRFEGDQISIKWHHEDTKVYLLSGDQQLACCEI